MALENELFKICKLLMLYGGAGTREMSNWPKFSQKLYKVLSLSSQILYASCLPLFSIELCMTFGNDMEAAVNVLNNLPFIIVVVAKMITVQSKEIRKLLELVENKELQIVSSKNAKVKSIYRHYTIYCHIVVLTVLNILFSTVSTYIGYAIYQSYHFYATQLNATATAPKPHPVQLWFPFNKDIYYKTAMAYQLFHIALTFVYNGMSQALLYSVIIFIQANLKILQYKIRNIDTNGITASQNIIKECIINYQKIRRVVDELNSEFQNIILLEYSVTSVSLASILINLLQGKNIVFTLLFFMLTTVQLFALSWNANEILLESSAGLSDALYECNWYNLDKSSKSLIIFMTMRCEKPLAIFIGPFGSLTIDAAISRMKLAYSVMSLLSTSSAA